MESEDLYGLRFIVNHINSSLCERSERKLFTLHSERNEGERKVPNDARDGRAMCPFYQRSKGDYICCECVIGGARLLHMFASRAEALGHMQEYCNTFGYVRCPYAMMLIGLYEKSEE